MRDLGSVSFSCACSYGYGYGCGCFGSWFGGPSDYGSGYYGYGDHQSSLQAWRQREL